MGFLINGVMCDAFAHVDSRKVSDTLPFSLLKYPDGKFTAFLYCNGSPFPVSKKTTAQCCIKSEKKYAKVLSLEGESRIEENRLIPSGFNIRCDETNYPVKEYITSLQNYGHGAGKGYNNTIDFERGIYTERCSLFIPEKVINYNEYLTYFLNLGFDIPMERYDEYIKAIETIKCSHSELTFEYWEVVQYENGTISSGALRVKLNGIVPSEEELQEFIDNQREAGTPVMICYGIPDFIETDISELIKDDMYIPVEKSVREISFDGNSCTFSDPESYFLAECDIGENGEITIQLPEDICRKNERLSCEINISGVDANNITFRYKAASFITEITE